MTRRRFVIVRHGQSLWNLQNRFTGWNDVGLTEQGEQEARAAAAQFKAAGMAFDVVYASALQRTRRTAEIVGAELGSVPIITAPALNERDYGKLAGLNKDEARERYGEEQIRRWRRSYAEAPPDGESLRDLQARLLGYHLREMLPAVMRGSRGVLMVGHGNTLRALIMAIENLSAVAIEKLEVATGEAVAYEYDADAAVVGRVDTSAVTRPPR